MKWLIVLVLVSAVWADVDDLMRDETQLAEPCDLSACQLPNCRCSSTEPPGGLNPRHIPQFVLVTFDDGVTITNINTYREIIYNRRNRNGCPAGTTFYINHEYTDYTLVNELYNQGLEIALHSITHQTPPSYWETASYDDLKMEFVDQREQMTHFARIPSDSIKGIRTPFLQMSGNTTFQVMADHGLLYDCTWPTINHINPGLWPYTLDYASIQECLIPPCPTASIPGVWVVPMISWLDLNGNACSMVDSCFFVPAMTDEEGWFRFIVGNFERHYFGNRAPFNFFIHEWFIAEYFYPAVRNAFRRFLDMINNMDDVFMVNTAEMLEWVRDPVPLDEYKQKPCRSFTPVPCPATSCGPISPAHDESAQYWMQVCNSCPAVYPWLGNPLGQ